MKRRALPIARLAGAALLALPGFAAAQHMSAAPARAAFAATASRPADHPRRVVVVDQFGRTVAVTPADGRRSADHGAHNFQRERRMHHPGPPLTPEQQIRRSQARIEAQARGIAHGNRGTPPPHRHR